LPRDIIAIAADHAGVELKRLLVEELRVAGFEPNDLGTNSDASVDYPDFAFAVAREVASARAAYGILICGTGIGMSIAANRHPGVRAALCTHGLMARFSREHNDANVLVLGSRVIGSEIARECLHQFLTTSHAGGRHAARVAKLTNPHFEEAAQ
jgi:ribose 5-phosphate isomerase B